jgi:hypothetical protein
MRLNFSEITNGGFVQAQLSAEQSLAYAVLQRAIRDVTGHRTYTESAEDLEDWRQKALSWFLKDEDGYSFTQVCEALNLDKQWTLKMLKHKLKELNGH